MSDISTQIVDWLYSNDASNIEKAFLHYSEDLELAIKKAFEQKSPKLTSISLSNLSMSKLLMESVLVRDDLLKTVKLVIDDIEQEV